MIFKEKLKLIILICFSLFLLEFSEGQEEKVIYGIDNRSDLYNISNSKWLMNSRSLKGCKKNRWIFGFDLFKEDKDYTMIPKKNIYQCIEVVDYR